MNLPDLTGMVLTAAERILSNEYPDIEYHINYYSSPKGSLKADNENPSLRVIRQRESGDGRLELVVSEFVIPCVYK